MPQKVRIALDAMGGDHGAAVVVPGAELSLVLTDDEAIRQLNLRWRGKDKATDVLSFPQLEQRGVATRRQLAQAVSLGDVVISVETARRQAAEAGRGLEAELVRLLEHGMLHLIGHDHVHGGLQARRMKREERRLLGLVARRAGARPRRSRR